VNCGNGPRYGSWITLGHRYLGLVECRMLPWEPAICECFVVRYGALLPCQCVDQWLWSGVSWTVTSCMRLCMVTASPWGGTISLHCLLAVQGLLWPVVLVGRTCVSVTVLLGQPSSLIQCSTATGWATHSVASYSHIQASWLVKYLCVCLGSVASMHFMCQRMLGIVYPVLRVSALHYSTGSQNSEGFQTVAFSSCAAPTTIMCLSISIVRFRKFTSYQN